MKQLWHNFTAAPHRVMFLGGALQSLAVMVWWLFDMAVRYGVAGQPAALPVAPVLLHAYLMIFGLLPFFMFGFLMTTFPRWMNQPEIPARHYVPAFLMLISGAAVFYLGLLGNASLLVPAVALTLGGWGMGLYALWQVLQRARNTDKRHTTVLFIAFSLGWCSLAVYLFGLATNEATYLVHAIQGGLWLFLLPVFASVAHRMIPFFTGSALSRQNIPRPFWPWWVMLAASALHALLTFADQPRWLWLADLPLALASLYLSYLWGFRRSLRIPLLAVLHVGYAWMGLAMFLFAVQSLLALLDQSLMGLAPLHALTIGCYATLMIGMGTRVTLGHSGLPFIINTPIKLMFVGIQCVALLRIAADLLPAHWSPWLHIAAALGWLGCFAPWVRRYLPAYWRPRADGRPG